MKIVFRPLIFIGFAILIAINIAVFVNGLTLSDELNYYESQITKLRQDSLELEKRVYKYDSVTYAASIAAELDFTFQEQTIYLKTPGYAYNR
ncbi:hypothetical protein A3F03_03430 [Candidatus Roizmanbacteria bacterium RIFCSPHIGHO2_12_FULL_41_11]|uniref:Uncharacterized protein n=2 Tax=Candidatus Roizmaniibacteriota TaxID=1752723 RepID=A0A1F7J7M3_9BACT|nr:MAG: hypothetical protein A3F03_03430 [Candidatus Roizmanbacteria bacterium RIFCSPHIGHO2_12_FULL_41_11]OGK51613.1 MAG: hypothetical protein A2966_01040 [Candidatus Roizmanbacteria bacterium RIFCSPLOWO2_01_FULL_41_22]